MHKRSDGTQIVRYKVNWTFLITLLILIICTVVGAFRGLIKTVYSLIIVVAVTVLTTIFAPKLTTYLKNNTTWDDALQSKTESFLRDRGILSDGRQIDLDELPVPDSIKNKISGGVADYSGKTAEIYNDFVVETVSGIIFSAIVYIVMFVLLLALAGVIGILLNVIEKLPVLKQINKLAGGAAGLVKGLLIVWIAAILVMILSNTPIGIKIAADIDGNVFLKFLYDKNLIMYFLTGGKNI